MSFGKCYDLLRNTPKQSTEEWEITFTSFSEEAAIWRIVPFSNAEELFMISTKQIESTHLWNNHTQFPTSHSSSFAPVPSSYSLHYPCSVTFSHLYRLIYKRNTADESISANFDASQNYLTKWMISPPFCLSSPPSTLRTKKEPIRPRREDIQDILLLS